MKSDTEEGEKGDDQVTCHVPPTCPPVGKRWPRLPSRTFHETSPSEPISAHPSRRSLGSHSGPPIFTTNLGRLFEKQADGAKRISRWVPHHRRILTVTWEEGIRAGPHQLLLYSHLSLSIRLSAEILGYVLWNRFLLDLLQPYKMVWSPPVWQVRSFRSCGLWVLGFRSIRRRFWREFECPWVSVCLSALWMLFESFSGALVFKSTQNLFVVFFFVLYSFFIWFFLSCGGIVQVPNPAGEERWGIWRLVEEIGENFLSLDFFWVM